MNKRFIWVAITLASLAVAGCKKEPAKPSEGGPATDKVAEAMAPMGAGQVAAAGSPATVDRLLATLPMDSDIVMGIDVGRMRDSAILAPLLDQLGKMNQGQMGFDMKAECGLDPAKVMDLGVFGIKMLAKDKVEVAGAFSGVPRGPTLTCIEKSRAKIEAEGAKVTIDGNYVLMTTKDGNLGMAYLDDNTAVMKFAMGPVDKAALDKMIAAKAGAGLTGSAEFMSMIKATNTGATLWALVNGNAPMMAQTGVKFKAAFGSVDVTDGVVADGRLRMNTPEEATKTAQMVNTQLAAVKGMGIVGIAEAKADANDVRLSITMTKDHIEKAKQTFGAMLGGMLGGMGGGGMGGMGGP